jgi:two-component system KDP operon response regulator KdpE
MGAVFRRTQALGVTEPVILSIGNLKIDLDRRMLWKGHKEIHLSRKEFDLIAFLMKNQGAPLTHARLLRAVWGPEYGNELEYLRSYVRMVRKKIEDDPARPEYLLTEPWVGYRFCNSADSGATGSELPADEE